MDRAVYEESRGLDAVRTGDFAPMRVHYHQIARHHFGPVQALRVDEKVVLPTWNCETEVIADAF